MSEPFDPYFKWLGIPPNERPIDFYRLLGVQHFESDPDVIANATDQRTAQIKGFLAGDHPKAAQRILNEIASARICLLAPETKAEYDKKLQAAGHGAAAARRPPTLPNRGAADAPVTVVASAPAVPAAVPNGAAAAEGGATESAGQWKMLAAALGIGTALALVIVGAILTMAGGDRTPVAQSDPPGQTGDPEPKPSPDPVEGDPDHGDPNVLPKPADPAPKDPAPKDPAPKIVITEHLVTENPDPKTPEGSPESPHDPAPKDPAPKEPAPEDPGPKAPSPKVEPPSGIFGGAKQKLPLPDDAALAKAEAAVREVFPIGRNLTKPQMLEMADKLFGGGLETKDDPAAAFVLMRMAADLAAKAGDFDKTVRIADRVAGLYDADLMDLKARALEESAKTVGAGPQAMPANMLLLQQADKLIRDALAEDDYQTALEVIVQVALPAARRTGDKRIVADLTKQQSEVRRMKEDFAQVEQALAALRADPGDAEANLTAGRYYGVQKGAWDKALPFLAKGSDAPLAAAAKKDLAGPAGATAQAEAGDAWWDLASSVAKESEKASLRARALHWYKEAVPSLSGLTKAKVERRIEEAGGTVGDWVLVFDGKKSYVGVPNFVYDGTVPITMEAIVVPASNRSYSTIVGNFASETDRSSQRGGLKIGLNYEQWGFDMFTRPPGDTYAYSKQVRANGYSTPGKRCHVAGIFAAQEMKLFVDGRLEGSEARTGMFAPSMFPFLVGAEPSQPSATAPTTPRNFFDGVIESVRISNVPRYTQDTFAPPKKLTLDRSTLLLLDFNQGKGDTVPNAAAAKHQAKIVDAQWMERAKWEELLRSRTSGGRRPRG